MASRVERIRLPAAGVPEHAATLLQRALTAAIEERGAATVCLAGGSTPRATYEHLATRSELDWTKIEVYFGDERAVPADHPESNYRQAREALLDRIPRPPKAVHRMRAEQADADSAARDYERLLPERMDVLVLGIGADGHTASLFPGSPSLWELERRVVAVMGPKPPAQRLTLTPPALAQAELTVVLATGESKADAVFEALEGESDVERCPAQLVRDAVWILDHAAARRLTGRWPIPMTQR